MAIKIKDGKKLCRTCNQRKPREDHHPQMQQTCLTCMSGRTPEEFREFTRVRKNKQRKVYRREHKEKLHEKLGDAKAKRGYIYLLHSKSKDLYKVGVSIDPYKRLLDLQLNEYQIKDLRLVAFSVPVNDAFKTECFIHNKLDKYRVDFIKPCGGRARELFHCDLNIVANLFVRCSQDINWKDRSIMGKVNLKDKGTLKYIETKFEHKIKMKMHRSYNDLISKKVLNPWYEFKNRFYQNVKCYATGDRSDHLFETMSHGVSLGVFDNYEDAKSEADEFKTFMKNEKNIHRKNLRKLADKYSLYYFLTCTPEDLSIDTKKSLYGFNYLKGMAHYYHSVVWGDNLYD